MNAPFDDNGFSPRSRKLGRERRTVTLAALIATIGLALATLIAATVVSVGIARAGSITDVIENETGLFVLALAVGILFIAMDGLTMLLRRGQKPRKPVR